MGFPWEVDEQPNRFPKAGSKEAHAKKMKSFAGSRQDTYKSYGHPRWYPQYLKTDHWKEFKTAWRASGRRRCCMICYNKRYDLHHWTYERIGNEEFDDVVPLCRAHHLQAHKLEKDGTPLAEAHKVLQINLRGRAKPYLELVA